MLIYNECMLLIMAAYAAYTRCTWGEYWQYGMQLAPYTT